MTKTTRIMQQSICQLVEFPEHRVVEECATPMARTERDRKASSFRSPVDLQEPYIALVDMGKIIRHNRSDYVEIIFRHNNATLLSSVLMTPMTQPTPLKMTNKTYEYRVGLMSPIYLHDPFPSARAFKTCSVAPATKGG